MTSAMTLELRPDFETAAANWDCFWAHRGLERPMIMCRTPRGEPRPHPPAGDLIDGDIDDCIEASLGWLRSFDWLGDAIPSCMPQLGPDHFAILLGAQPRVNPASRATVWTEPCIDRWEDFEIRVRWEGRWWRRTVDLIERYRERCAGICLVSPPNLQGGLDCLAALRGVEALERDWSDLYRQIDLLGKGVYLLATPERLRQFRGTARNRMLCCELRTTSRREAEAALAEFGA